MKKFFFYTTIFLGTLAILVTLGSAIATEDFWWIKVLDFPRIQTLILAVIFLGIFLWLRDDWGIWKVLFTLGLVTSVVIQVYYLYPYSGLVSPTVGGISRQAAPPQSTFDLMVANVYIHNRDVDDLLAIVDEVDPDMFLAIETNQWWENALQPLDESYPYGMEYPLDNTFGMILYSKFPLQNQEIMFLQYDSVPSFHARVKLPGGKTFEFHGVHPVPPYPQAPGPMKDEETALVKVGEMVASNPLPAVVAGDLNDVAWARRERLFEQEGILNDVRIGRGIYSTFSAKSWFIKWPLDYVYVTQGFAVVDFRRLPEFGSDHYPIYIELGLLEEERAGFGTASR